MDNANVGDFFQSNVSNTRGHQYKVQKNHAWLDIRQYSACYWLSTIWKCFKNHVDSRAREYLSPCLAPQSHQVAPPSVVEDRMPGSGLNEENYLKDQMTLTASDCSMDCVVLLVVWTLSQIGQGRNLITLPNGNEITVEMSQSPTHNTQVIHSPKFPASLVVLFTERMTDSCLN